ncbi:OPT family oligopeptide transporter, partial [bacterium]|nr:OPT family oligopeptide transporter [bacterium]
MADTKPRTGKLTPDEIELNWYHHHYRGDSMKQLTSRAVLMGSLLGAVMSVSNIYIGLKTGWGFGVAITACVLSYAIWKSLMKARIAKSEMTVLENNAMQSTASAAGYSTGGTLVSAIAAYVLINEQHIPYGWLTAWIFFLAVLGVTMAIPMKRQMINTERLPFPSGIAAGLTLRSLHADYDHKPALERPVVAGVGELAEDLEDRATEPDAALDLEGAMTSEEQGQKSANALFGAGAIGGLIAILHEIGTTLHDIGLVKKPFTILDYTYPIFGKRAANFTVEIEGSLLLVAGGMLMGLRVAASVFLGSILCWMVFVPWMHNIGVIESLNYRDMVSWSLWGGAACMVTSGLTAFAMQWKAVARAMKGITDIFKLRSKQVEVTEASVLDRIEVPPAWFATGGTVGAVGVIVIAMLIFDMPLWMGLLAVIMSFFLALVACRVAGETDVTPVGAMGKVTQLFYGAIARGQTNINLMAACITAGVADSASDLLIDLKSGYVLGANPRKQFLAQFSGIFVGTLVTVPLFYL